MKDSKTYRLETPVGTAFITVIDSNPMEIIVNVGKAGSNTYAMAEGMARAINVGLRQGVEAEIYIEQLRYVGGGQRGVFMGEKEVFSLPDALAQALAIHIGYEEENNG